MLILPGVAGDSNANYVKEMVLGAHRNGYKAAVLNGLAGKNEKCGEYRVLDFCDSMIIR